MTPAARSAEPLPGLSLRAKLTLWFLAISFAIQVTLMGVLLFYQRAAVNRFFDQRLRQRADVIADRIRQAGFQISDDLLRSFSDAARRFVLSEARMVTLYSIDGSVIASDIRPALSAEFVGFLPRSGAALPPRPFKIEIPGLADEHGATQARGVLESLESPDGARYVLFMATSDTYYRTVIDQTERVLLLSLPVGMLAAAISGWMIGGLAIRPFEHFRRLSETLAPESIETDVEPTATPPEVAALERDLQETRAKLRNAFQAQDRFVSSVSHELKTPIATLLAEAQTLRTDGLSPEALQFVRSVTDETRRLGRMTESFLTLTRIRGGNALPVSRPADTNEFVMDAIADCRKMARQHDVQLVPKLATDGHSLLVSGDAELLRVAVDNLVRNAIRFSSPGQAVDICVTTAGSEVEIRVRDRGPGVPPELLDKLFDRFVQAADEAQRARGHGLGLTIAQGITELHGGRINVRNIEDGGCEFVIRLPVLTPDSRGGETTSHPETLPPPN